MSSPSNRNTWQNCALQSLATPLAIVSKTGWALPGELAITRSTSEVRRLLLQRLSKVSPRLGELTGVRVELLFHVDQ
jgi:hypothetical protein